MDDQITASLADVEESFQCLTRLESPLRTIPEDELKRIRNFHVTRIRLNLEALRQKTEDYSNV